MTPEWSDCYLPGEPALFSASCRPAEPWALVGIVHGYGDHGGRFRDAMLWLAARGIASSAVDLRGHGRSEGRRGAVRRWDDYLTDLDRFASALIGGNHLALPCFLLGHSHGGLVVAAAAERTRLDVAGCILSAPYLNSLVQVPAYKRRLAALLEPILPDLGVPSGLKHEWMSDDSELLEESRHDPLLLRIATPRWFREHQEAQQAAMHDACRFTLPLLTLVASKDVVSDPVAIRAFHDATGSADRTLHVFPDARHELLRDTCREEVLACICDWIRPRAEAARAARITS